MTTRKICRSFLLRTWLNMHPRQSYFSNAEHRLHSHKNCFRKSIILPRRVSSVSSQPHVSDEQKHLVDEFPSPKKIIWRLLNEAYILTRNPEIKPHFSEEMVVNGAGKVKWKYTIHMRWPENFQAQGVSSKKHEAENNAYLQACQKMKELALLDNENKPLLPGQKNAYDSEKIASAKSDLLNLFQRIFLQHGRNPDYLPKFQNEQKEGVIGKEMFWKSQLHLTYPEEKTFESYAGRLKEAESINAAEALLWLEKVKAFITNKRRLVNYSKEEEEKLFKTHTAPYSICIPSPLKEKMSSLLPRLKELFKEGNCSSLTENFSNNEDIHTNQNEISKLLNLITDEVYYEASEDQNISRSHEMFQKYVSHSENSDPNVQEIRKLTANLPIAKKKQEILKLVDENQVVILYGEPGCGKTTQVPQYILDEYIGKFKGASCNILVSQPRRISAISIAERIAFERGEEAGETIGYQVRLNKKLPKQNGAVLFCSTGMLLRKLHFNPDLHGISHVIVDEVHERSFQIDMLLILLKRALEINKNVKILIMSASFNTTVFSQYFNNCPVILVPGNMYNVKEYYLDQLPSELVGTNHQRKFNTVLDSNLVANVINYIHNTRKNGAILCFLPGWREILAVKNKLLEICKDPLELKICCAHSRLTHNEQKVIFDSVPTGVRKIILATNIAETSITVNDVVYVVDSGLQKGTTFDGLQGVASLGTQWITQANVRQRKGRAGRVQEGVCYHLFPQRILTEMEGYPAPEIVRMPLESVILDCKLYCPDSKAADFLSMALQPPSPASLQIGVKELQTLGVLDENENLTDLGKVIVNFATHPRLSIALIYACFLKCLDPILTICAILTLSKEPFSNALEDNSPIKLIKQGYHNNWFSDHLAMTKIFDTWNKLNEGPEAENFIQENLLDEQNLLFAKELKALFAESMVEAGVIDETNTFKDPESEYNVNRNHVPSIFSVLTAAFYPNVMKVNQGEISRGKINKDTVIYSLIKGQRGYIQKESIASKEDELPSPFLVYFKGLFSEARRMMMISSASSVPGICLLLFGGQELSTVNEENKTDSDNVILMLDNYKKLTFSCTKEEAELLLVWRHHLRNLFRTYTQTLNFPNNEHMSFYNEEFLPVLKEIISTPQVPFTKGQLYKFENNELVSEEV